MRRRAALHVECLEHRWMLNAAPIVDLGEDRLYTEGDVASLYGFVTDPDGDVDLFYEWDVDFDGDSFDTFAANEEISYPVPASGAYIIALRVTDPSGDWGLDEMLLTVLNAPPFGDAGPDRTADQGQTVAFHADASDPGTPSDELTYAWDFDYDGQTFDVQATTIDAGHAYLVPGTYRVAMRVTDPYNASVLDEVLVTVANVAPTADAGPGQTIEPGATANFHATASDPGQPVDTLHYEWDFAYDGQTFDVDAVGQDASHGYTEPGAFRVAVRVRDDFGGVTVDETTVTVRDALPDLVLESVTTPRGDSRVEIAFRVESAAALTTSVRLTLYATTTGAIDGRSRALRTITLEPGDLTPGRHVLVRSTAELGFPMGQLVTTWCWESYRLAARLDSAGAVREASEANNDVFYAGVYRLPGADRWFVQGGDGADVVTVQGDRRSLTLTLNGVSYVSSSRFLPHVVLHLQGGDDVLKAGSAVASVFAWGGNGNDILEGGRRPSALFGGDGDDVMVSNAIFDLLYGGRGKDRYVWR